MSDQCLKRESQQAGSYSSGGHDEVMTNQAIRGDSGQPVRGSKLAHHSPLLAEPLCPLTVRDVALRVHGLHHVSSAI